MVKTPTAAKHCASQRDLVKIRNTIGTTLPQHTFVPKRRDVAVACLATQKPLTYMTSIAVLVATLCTFVDVSKRTTRPRPLSRV